MAKGQKPVMTGKIIDAKTKETIYFVSLWDFEKGDEEQNAGQ